VSEEQDDLTLVYMYGFKNGEQSMKAEIERLRAALLFYADESADGYNINITNYGLSTEEGAIIVDAGNIARIALEGERTND